MQAAWLLYKIFFVKISQKICEKIPMSPVLNYFLGYIHILNTEFQLYTHFKFYFAIYN